ncbi:hypothetical protein AB3S75_033405 [Citrus x aurantiifolia]
MPRETVRLLYCVAKRDRRRIFSDAVQALDEKDRKENNPPEGHTSRSTNPHWQTSICTKPAYREKEKCKKGQHKKRCFGSVRYANGEYAAKQPQGLPAVIAELTRWAAQNLEQPLKSEINVGSRLSEKGRRLKQRITKCNTTRANQASKEEANQSEWRQGGKTKERFSSLPASSKQKRLFSRIVLPQLIRWAG